MDSSRERFGGELMVKIVKTNHCKHNLRIICGVFKNTNNCSYPNVDLCKAENDEKWLGMPGPENVGLRTFIFNGKEIKMKILDENMCDVCHVIFIDTLDKCPVCNKGG